MIFTLKSLHNLCTYFSTVYTLDYPPGGGYTKYMKTKNNGLRNLTIIVIIIFVVIFLTLILQNAS